MTRSVSPTMKTHLDGDVTTLARCWFLVRPDGGGPFFGFYGFTDHDQDLVVDYIIYQEFSFPLTFKSIDSGNLSAVEQTSDSTTDNAEASLILSDDGITVEDLRGGRWDHAEFYEFIVNYTDTQPIVDKVKISKGWLGNVTTADLVGSVELISMMQKMNQTVGRTVGIDCDAVFSDDRCTLDESNFSTFAEVASVINQSTFTASLGYTDEYYKYGKVNWFSGTNQNLSMEIKRYHAGTGTVVLFLPMPGEISAGDSFEIIAGCDKTWETCKNIFENGNNFRGFPTVPGPDELINYVK